MEAKKTAKADLENKRGVIFGISLILSLAIVIMAFEWKQPEKQKEDLVLTNSNSIETIIDVPVTEIIPPPPILIQQPRIIEVPNEEEIQQDIDVKFDIEINQNTKVAEFTIMEVPKVEKEEPTNEIFIFVEQSAAPKDGMSAFYKDIGQRLKYPKQAIRMGVEGRVFVEFVVNRDGTLTDIVVVKGIGAGCDEEAVRVLKEVPPWNPAKQRARYVRQSMVLPISFKIQNR
jgi:protein TonB